MDNRFSSTRRTPQDEYLQYKPARAALDTRVTSTSLRFKDKDLMHGLNDRLAGFIEKVHQLEHQNQLLEREIEEIRGKAKPASCLEEEYGPELRKLRKLVQDISHQKHQIEIEHQNLEDEVCNLKRRHELEARGRSESERSIVLLKKDISDAYQAKLHLDKKARALVDEIQFLKTNHEAEVSEMFEQIQSAQVSVKAQGFGDPGVTAALRGIRAQLEGHNVSELQQVGETFRSQFAKLTEAAENKREALRVTQQEIQEYRRRLQAKNIELDCAKGTREGLEKQLHDVEDRHKEEMIHYQNTIKELENELINCKFDMSGYLREYQDLLNVKMALDVEIMSYRKLLCGEEARLSSMSDSHVTLPYIYHQSPIYTLPCLSRPGAPHRRAEPQYKFVEEIITETTREIEMSEFEETGSEGTEGGNDEQGCTKRDGGGSEEEEGGDKDGGEEEGEQVPDGEQDQDGGSVKGAEDESPIEIDDTVKGQISTEETEEDDEVQNTESKVLFGEKMTEEDNEHDRDIDEITKDKENAVVHKDFYSKPEDSTPEEKKTDDGEKTHPGGDQVTKPGDESLAEVSTTGLDKTQELSSDVQVKNKDQASASEKEEVKRALSDKTEDTSEKTLKPEEKEKEISRSESARSADKAATDLQEAKDDRNKEAAPVSNGKSLPEAEEKKQSGSVQSVLPKKKTNADTKELHQGAAESSRDENSELTEVSKKMSSSQGKAEKNREC